MSKKNCIPHITFLLSLGLLVPAFADVTVEQKLRVDAAGALSMAAMEGTTVTAIVARNARTDNDLKFKSALVRTFAGGAGKTSSIIRLDEERIIDLDHKKKRYTDTTFAEMRAQTQEAMQQMAEASATTSPGEPGGTALPVTEENCEWSEPVLKVTRSGEQKEIAGLAAQQSAITATQTCRDPETGKACDLIWTLEQWLAPEAPGGEEMRAFWTGYAQKLGFDELAGQPGMPAMTQLFSQYRQGWEEIEEQMGGLAGYPVKTVMHLDIGGDECTTPEGQPISNQTVFGEAVAEAAGGAAAESVGGAAGGVIGGAIAKGLFKTFGKKKKAEEVAVAEPVTGTVQLFRVESETTRIATDAVSADRFEIPGGYRPAD
jgi:hypothetical protein